MSVQDVALPVGLVFALTRATSKFILHYCSIILPYQTHHAAVTAASASTSAPIAVIKSLAEAFAALGFLGANKSDSDEVGTFVVRCMQHNQV